MLAKPDPKKILDEAMQLDPTARAFVAEMLLESLDLDQDFAVSPEWLEEIRRRCADINSSKARLLDSTMVISELREKHNWSTNTVAEATPTYTTGTETFRARRSPATHARAQGRRPVPANGESCIWRDRYST